MLLNIKAREDAYDVKISGDYIKFYLKPQYEKRFYELCRTYLWTLFNRLSMDQSFNPLVKPGVRSSKVIKPWKEEGRIDKKSYKVFKPDIEHIEMENMNTEEMTSDSSEDEGIKEEKFSALMGKSELKKYDKIKKQEYGSYGETKDIYGDFHK